MRWRSGRRRGFQRSITWRSKSWVGASASDSSAMVLSGATYSAPVLFVPLVQVTDYSTYPLDTTVSPIPTSTQERIRLLRSSGSAQFAVFGFDGAPGFVWLAHAAYYLAKFSLREVVNSVLLEGAAPGALFDYDPLSDGGPALYKQPIVRHGHQAWNFMQDGLIPLSTEWVETAPPGRSFNWNIPMKMSLQSDEEFYLVITADAQQAGVTPDAEDVVFLLNVQARTQFAT